MDYRCGRCKCVKNDADFMPSQRKNGAYCRECMHAVNQARVVIHPPRPCEQCQVVIERPNPKARFCSVKCKNEAKIARTHAAFLAKAAARSCQHCGASLAGRRTDTRWCSERCGLQFNAQRRSAVRRKARLKAKFGISEAEYERMVKAQRGKCAICQDTDPRNPYGKWAIDHDHVTGQVRGLLCSTCNTGIGQLQDNPDVIAAAARYIRKHRQMVLPV